MTHRSLLAPVLALLLGAALLLAPAGPATAAADPPRIDRLTGRILHTASGETVPIRVGRRHQNSLELLGEVRQGWLVAHHWEERLLVVSPEGRLVRSVSYARYEEYPGNAELLLSGNGRHVLATAGRRLLALDARDGAVVTSRRLARDTVTVGPGVWEDEGHVLVDVRRGERHTLLRCGLADRCERALPWQRHPLLDWDYSTTR